jgi:hypothetical protein
LGSLGIAARDRQKAKICLRGERRSLRAVVGQAIEHVGADAPQSGGPVPFRGTPMVPLLNAALLAAIVLVADRVPSFNVEAHCRRVAREAHPVGDPHACLQEEQEARAKLVAQWTQFSAADRSYCRDLTALGGEPTFTELLTCLEMRREAERLRDKENATTGAPANGRALSPLTRVRAAALTPIKAPVPRMRHDEGAMSAPLQGAGGAGCAET